MMSYKNLLNRFGIHRKGRKDYYECGFRPTKQKPITISLQFIVIALFFLIYDIELIFSFPLVASAGAFSLSDVLGFLLIYSTFIVSLFYDYDKNLLSWKFI